MVQKKGVVLPLNESPNFIATREQVPVSLRKKWEILIQGDIWQYRKKWFLKPLAMMITPFTKTLWLDLDCEVRINLDSLFHFLNNQVKLALVQKPPLVFKTIQEKEFFCNENKPVYNSGVIVYHKSSDIIKMFAKRAKTDSHLFFGDEDLLSDILNKTSLHFTCLEEKYNSVRPNIRSYQSALIAHWGGAEGKLHIREEAKKLFSLSFVHSF